MVIRNRKMDRIMKKATVRIEKLINNFLDISPNIVEIDEDIDFSEKCFFGFEQKSFKVDTNLGKRAIVVYKDCLTLEIAFYETIREPNFYSRVSSCKTPLMFYKDLLFSIKITNRDINIKPGLDCNNKITEKQIYDCILELEQIFQNYEYPKKTDLHKFNLNNFINRFR